MPRAKSRKLTDIERAYDTVARTEAGIVLFQHLLAVSGYKEGMHVINPQTREINPLSTLYNLSKRDFWVEIRKNLTEEQIHVIENTKVLYELEQEEESND